MNVRAALWGTLLDRRFTLLNEIKLSADVLTREFTAAADLLFATQMFRAGYLADTDLIAEIRRSYPCSTRVLSFLALPSA